MATDTQKSVATAAQKEYGQSGTLIYQGIITAEEYNNKLLGRQGLKIFDEMRKGDSDVQELLKAVKLPIRSVTWDVEPASDDQADKDEAEHVKSELFDRNVNWSSLLNDILTMDDFGFSVFEKVYEYLDDKSLWGIKKIASRKQYSILRWQMKNGEPGVTQQVVGELLDIPESKLVVFTNDKEGDNYQGVSILRYVYRDWYAKKILTNIHLVALERLGSGVPILMPPPQPDPKDVEKARAALRRMRANQEAYVELPAGWSIEMLDMKSNSVKDILPTLQYLGGNIKKSGLAGFLELGSRSNGGSRAVSQDHSELFEKSLEAQANNIAATLNENLIQQLCDLNRSDHPNGYPKLTFGNIGDEDLSGMGQYLSELSQGTLITPDPDMENHLRKIARLPDLPDDIYKNYENRQINQRELRRVALTQEDPELEELQPKNATPAPKTTGDGKKPEPSLGKDGKNKPTPVTNTPVKADAIKKLHDARQALIDVVLG